MPFLFVHTLISYQFSGYFGSADQIHFESAHFFFLFPLWMPVILLPATILPFDICKNYLWFLQLLSVRLLQQPWNWPPGFRSFWDFNPIFSQQPIQSIKKSFYYFMYLLIIFVIPESQAYSAGGNNYQMWMT